MPARPVLQSVVPLGAVPGRLQAAVAKAIEPWGYTWADISFSGTALLPPQEHSRLGPGSDEVWVFAVTVGSLQIGDQLEAAGSRAAGLSLSAFSGGVIPVTPFQARVFEYLGGHGGGSSPAEPSPSGASAAPRTEPAARDQQR